MELLSFYPQIKQAHIGLVAASGLLFALRGAAVLAGGRWAMQATWRWSSVVVDTLLLSAGVLLWTLLSLDPLHGSPWLGTKLLLLLLYIVLGSLALRRGRSAALRQACYAAALCTYLFMVTVAIKHHPLGLFY